MKRGQGAVEYIIILGVIILIALIVVGSLGGFGIFEFSTTSSQRTTEISNLLGDVGLKYAIADNGSLTISVRAQTTESINIYNFSIENSTGGACWIILINEMVRQEYKNYQNSTSCAAGVGVAGESYSYTCTLRYRDSSGIDHGVVGICQGDYERS